MPSKESTPAPAHEALRKELQALRAQMRDAVQAGGPALKDLDPGYQESACNLLAYLALRRHDLRDQQLQLAELGLSSLGRSEGCILSSLDAVIALLQRLDGIPPALGEDARQPDLPRSRQLLAQHSDALFGPPPLGRDVRIMVTLPGEAADNYSFIRDLLLAKADSLRINCAHDSPAQWLRMIEHARRAQRELGQPCHVMMDLPGPKIRTGPIQPGPAVIKVKPGRNDLGQVLRPARVWLTAIEHPVPAPSAADAQIPVAGSWLVQLQAGQSVALRDARGAKRLLRVMESLPGLGCWAQLQRTAYLTPGIVLTLRAGQALETPIGPFAPKEGKIFLQKGDLLQLTGDGQEGRPASQDSAGGLLTPARIGCTLPEVLQQVRCGELVWFDDGKIGGVVESVGDHGLNIRITQAAGTVALKADKGINFPQSDLRVQALGPRDLEALAFAAQHADGVEMSFVNRPSDVLALLQALDALPDERLGIVLKIETRKGFEHLPALLLTGMRRAGFGVMIARGDLAVEGGFERMAELQEEILCLCEAAHVPVIWATQVLETLAKKGLPSRAEITDAASAERAECVMLNKGVHLLEAVRVLDDLLIRMRGHRHKNRQLLRRLKVAAQPDLGA